jgi:hypothetical protein
MNPFRALWKKVVTAPADLKAGLTHGFVTLIESAREYDSETKVHGFYRRVSLDGKEKGFGFHCPVRGGSDPAKPLNNGATVTHCGRTDVLNTNALLPAVRMKGRYGKYRISADGTQAVPTDAFDGFNGEFPYEPSDPKGF